MSELVLIPLLAAHLMCVNVASAGPLACLWFEWREGRGDELAGRAGRFLAGAALVLLIAGSLLGLSLAALRWSDAYRDVLLVRLRSRVVFGAWEWLFSFVLMALHYVWWRAAPKTSAWLRALRGSLPLLAGTNLLYHFPFLFIIAANLAAAPEQPGETIASAQFRELMAAGDTPARATHFVLASFAMCGIALLGYARRLARRGASEEEVRRMAAWGGRIALAPTLLQIPVGLWVMTQLPRSAQAALLGGDVLGASLLGASLLAAFGLMHHLSAAAMGDSDRRLIARSAGLMALVVLLMSAVLLRAL